MADLLGSILSSMDKPPTVGNKEKQVMKKQKEALERRQVQEKERLKKLRAKIEDEVNVFIQNSDLQNFKFPPADKVSRSIMHDVADIAGLAAFSFGEDEVDRYVMLFKKEFAPSDEELLAYRRGEEWDPEKAKELANQKESDEDDCRSKKKIVPNCNYYDKYKRIIGTETAKDAARIATPNKHFGFVPSENKRDQRSIEQALADIKAKKQKMYHEEQPQA